MNRLQTEMRIILLPLDFFVPGMDEPVQPTSKPITIYSEVSSFWVKSFDSYKFLSTTALGTNQFNIKFILPSERHTGFNHLYYNEVVFDKVGNILSTSECEISGGQNVLGDYDIQVSQPKPVNPADPNSKKHRIVTFCSTGPSPLESHLFAVGIDDQSHHTGSPLLTTKCCQLTKSGYYHTTEVSEVCIQTYCRWFFHFIFRTVHCLWTVSAIWKNNYNWYCRQ